MSHPTATTEPITPALADALTDLTNDTEIIEVVTLTLHPDWEPSPAGVDDKQLAHGRAHWRGVVDLLTRDGGVAAEAFPAAAADFR